MIATKSTRSERATTLVLLAAGLSVTVIGLVDLLGWVLRVPVLTMWKVGTNPMAPITAMLFVLFGAALCLNARMPQDRTALLLTLIGWVGLMTSLLLFVLHLLGVYGSIELLGLHITGTFGDAPIGYISPITVFCFVLAYGSLLASLSYGAGGSWQGGLLWSFGGVVSLTSFALLLAYAFGTPILSGKVLIHPALNTSFGLLIIGLSMLVLAARYTRRLAASSDADEVSLLPYALVFIVFSAGTIAVMYNYYREIERSFRQGVESQLLAVSELKTDELVWWRRERLGDAALSQSIVTDAVRQLLETPQSVSAEREMQDWLGKYLRQYGIFGYDRAFLFDAKGATRMSVPDTTEPAAAILVERAVASLRLGQVTLQDFYRDEHDQRVYLALMVPILDTQDGNRPLGVVVLRINPSIFLFPLIKLWPTPSTTAETLLVRRDGNDVLFLNDLRFHADAALTLRFPLISNTELPAVKAVLGQRGIVDGADYRGVPVIAAVGAVPESPWYIVTRMDTAEVYAPLSERMWLTLFLVSILICSAGTVLILLWRQQRLVFYRRQLELTSALRVNEERHQRILNSAIDGFWLIDTQGCLLEVNEAYCRMSGYSEQELLSMRISDLEAVETPEDTATHLQKIIAKGDDRFESRHRRKDGSLFDVEVSIQYQSLQGGRFVTFLQDITERKQLEDVLQKNEEAFRMLFESSHDAIMTLTAKGNFLRGNPAAIALFGCRDEQEFIALSPANTSPEFQPDGRRSNEKVREMIQLALNKGLNFFEWMHKMVDGTEFLADVLLTRMETDGKTLLQATVRDITLRKQVEDAQKEIHRVKSELLDKLNDAQYFAMIGSWEWDLPTNYVWWSDETYRIFGVTPQNYVPSFEANRKFIHPDDVATYDKSFAHCFQTSEQLDLKLRLVTNDGVLKHIHTTGEVVYDDSGQQIRFIGTIMDITERKQAEEQLHLAASVFTHAREGIIITAADGTIIDVNDAFSDITGYSREEILGRNLSLLSSGLQEKEFYDAMWRDLVEHGYWHGEVWNQRKNGEVYAVMETISAVRDEQGNTRQYVTLYSDITQLKEHEQKLERSAHFDALTNLPNRVLLADRLHQGMAQARRQGQRLAVAFLDLDGFKTINDKHGHEVGDQLLIGVATRMKQPLRESDTLARLGGDEFVVVLADIGDIETCVPMLTRLLAAAAEPVQIGGLSLQISASLGVTFYPQTGDIDADQLLRQADQAMYQAKQAGKNRYHLFDAELDRSIRSRYENLEHIRHGLDVGEFVLYYQPKVNMRTGTVTGAEALIRWQHPEKGLLLPELFLPEIEDHSLAINLGEWVINTALTQMEIWHDAGLNIPVSVNIGSRQLLQEDFVERLRALLAAHPNVSPGDLELEVLETSAMESLTKASLVIDACRKMGVSFSLDDFGTGYSSLTYLKRLPVAQLKIDRSFVHDMIDNLDDLFIVEGVIGLASSFRLLVIAEGAETAEHSLMLLQLGCDLVQGYGIAYPIPAHELPGWKSTWRPDPVWAEFSSVSRVDLPLLFARIEHRTWIIALEKYLKGEREAPPPLNNHQCRFGQWLDTEGLARYGAQPSFEAIEPLHRQIHTLAAELYELHTQDCNQEALVKLGELHSQWKTLLDQLKTLVQEIRQ